MIIRILIILSIFFSFCQNSFSNESSSRFIQNIFTENNNTTNEGGSTGSSNPLKESVREHLNMQQILDLQEWLNTRQGNFDLESLLDNYLNALYIKDQINELSLGVEPYDFYLKSTVFKNGNLKIDIFKTRYFIFKNGVLKKASSFLLISDNTLRAMGLKRQGNFLVIDLLGDHELESVTFNSNDTLFFHFNK